MFFAWWLALLAAMKSGAGSAAAGAAAKTAVAGKTAAAAKIGGSGGGMALGGGGGGGGGMPGGGGMGGGGMMPKMPKAPTLASQPGMQITDASQSLKALQGGQIAGMNAPTGPVGSGVIRPPPEKLGAMGQLQSGVSDAYDTVLKQYGVRASDASDTRPALQRMADSAIQRGAPSGGGSPQESQVQERRFSDPLATHPGVGASQRSVGRRSVTARPSPRGYERNEVMARLGGRPTGPGGYFGSTNFANGTPRGEPWRVPMTLPTDQSGEAPLYDSEGNRVAGFTPGEAVHVNPTAESREHQKNFVGPEELREADDPSWVRAATTSALIGNLGHYPVSMERQRRQLGQDRYAEILSQKLQGAQGRRFTPIEREKLSFLREYHTGRAGSFPEEATPQTQTEYKPGGKMRKVYPDGEAGPWVNRWEPNEGAPFSAQSVLNAENWMAKRAEFFSLDEPELQMMYTASIGGMTPGDPMASRNAIWARELATYEKAFEKNALDQNDPEGWQEARAEYLAIKRRYQERAKKPKDKDEEDLDKLAVDGEPGPVLGPEEAPPTRMRTEAFEGARQLYGAYRGYKSRQAESNAARDERYRKSAEEYKTTLERLSGS